MFLPDYQTVTDDGVRSMFNEIWQNERDFSAEKGLTVVEIMDAVYDGRIRGMYIMGENPAMSDPDVEHARAALAKLEHLVVQDIFLTESGNYADVILPATAWAEKAGTVTNTNRQVQLGRPAVAAPGEARPDWWITIQIARGLGLDWNYGLIPASAPRTRASPSSSATGSHGRAVAPASPPPASSHRMRCLTASTRWC